MSSVSVIIPTRHEADNIPLLIALLDQHAPPGCEVLIVDDSDTQDTIQAVDEARAAAKHVYVRWIHRQPIERSGSLSGAVLLGLARARPLSRQIVVMDGDMQHPPQAVPQLLAALSDHDIVVASRYCPGGSAAGLNGIARHLVSRVVTALTRLVFPRRVGRVRDPLAGFFAVNRSALELKMLRTVGFKILVDILVMHPAARTTEVPVAFDKRDKGASKATLTEGLTFFRHLLWLRFHAS